MWKSDQVKNLLGPLRTFCNQRISQKTSRFKIIFAGISGMPERQAETRLIRDLNRELSEQMRDVHYSIRSLPRRFPIDKDTWSGMVKGLPETELQLLGREKCDLLIWGRADTHSKSFTLHFRSYLDLKMSNLDGQHDPANGAVTFIDELPISPGPHLVPFIASAILANLWSIAARRNISLNPSLQRACSKMSLRLKEQLIHAPPSLACTLRYLYAWTTLQTGKYSQAIKIFEDLLSKSPENRTRGDYTQICANLATARLAKGLAENSAEDLECALETTNRALSVFCKDHAPLRWAGLQMLQARIHRALYGQYRDMSHLQEAVTAIKSASMSWQREGIQEKWCKAQNELGSLLHQMGERETGTSLLQSAAITYRAILDKDENGLTHQIVSEIKYGLAVTLLLIAKRDGGLVRTKEAVAALRTANTAATKAQAGYACLNLASGLVVLGRLQQDPAPLEEAINILRISNQDDEHRFALGLALSSLGRLRCDEKILREACELLQSGENNERDLATTLAALGELSTGTQELEAALNAFDRALKATDRQCDPRDWSQMQRQVAHASLLIAKRHPGKAKRRFQEAISAYRQALTALKRDRSPLLWAKIQRETAEALSLYAASGGGTQNLEQAAEAYTKALGVLTPDTAPVERAMTLNNLGNILADLGTKLNSRDRLESAKQAYAEAFDISSANAIEDLASLTSKNITRTQTAIKSLRQRF